MSHSQRLRLADLRKSSELIGNLIELGASPAAWRAHMLRGVASLARGKVSATLDASNAFPGHAPCPLAPMDQGWGAESERKWFHQYLATGEAATDPSAIALFARLQRTRFVTACRRELTPDDIWYASPCVLETRRRSGVDDFLVSTVALSPGLLHGFGIYRGWGEGQFRIRDRRLIRFFHVALLRLLVRSIRPQREFGAALAPRLRATFDLLLAGLSVKQIASALTLSPHTVNDYMKVVYRRFGVASRVELLHNYHARTAGLLALPEELVAVASGITLPVLK